MASYFIGAPTTPFDARVWCPENTNARFLIQNIQLHVVSIIAPGRALLAASCHVGCAKDLTPLYLGFMKCSSDHGLTGAPILWGKGLLFPEKQCVYSEINFRLAWPCPKTVRFFTTSCREGFAHDFTHRSCISCNCSIDHGL